MACFFDKRMVSSGRKKFPVGIGSQLCRYGIIDTAGSCTELPVVVSTPYPKCAVGFERGYMVGTAGHLFPIGIASYLHERRLCGGMPQSELSVCIFAFHPKRAVFFEGSHKAVAGSDIGPGGVAMKSNGCVETAFGNSPASPVPERAVAVNRQHVIVFRSDFLPALRRDDRGLKYKQKQRKK